MHNHRQPPPATTKPPRHPVQPSTSPRYDDSDENDTGAMILAEKYYSPLASPSPISSISPPSINPTIRDDFPPPRFNHHIIRLNTSPPPPQPPQPPLQPPPPQTSIINTQEVLPSMHHNKKINTTFNWKEESPPPPPPLPPPMAQSGLIYGDGGGGERKVNVKLEKPSKSKIKMKMGIMKKVGLVIRVLEIVFCVVSFSVMASDKTQGWSGDSFDRYSEYRFCYTINIIGFAYAGFQALKLAFQLTRGTLFVAHHLCYKFDFFADQIIAYLLVSASTAAAARVNDWQLNWGKDEFTEKASMSVTMAFLAFIAFACSSLISGYDIFNYDD